MTTLQPKVTIITVVRNAAGDLKKTIESVLSQNYPRLEFILIDGGSTDGTPEVIRTYEGNLACWVSEPDRGIYDAMNKGLARATGDWVNFMNAGDTFNGTDAISKVMASDLGGYAVVYGDSIAAYRNKQVFKPAGPPARMVTGMVFCHQAAFVRRELIGTEGFDLSYPIGADFKVLFGLYTSGHQFLKLPFTVAVFEASGLSNMKMVQSAREHLAIVRSFQKLNLAQRLYHYSFICWVALVAAGYRILPAGLVERVWGRI